jgi:hypothetical protein
MKTGRDGLDNNHYIEQVRRRNGYRSYSISADYTITDTDKIKTIWGTAQATTTITVTLPNATNNLDRSIDVMKMDSTAGDVKIAGAVPATTTQMINGAASVSLTAQYEKRTVKTDGSNWYVLVAS